MGLLYEECALKNCTVCVAAQSGLPPERDAARERVEVRCSREGCEAFEAHVECVARIEYEASVAIARRHNMSFSAVKPDVWKDRYGQVPASLIRCKCNKGQLAVVVFNSQPLTCLPGDGGVACTYKKDNGSLVLGVGGSSNASVNGTPTEARPPWLSSEPAKSTAPMRSLHVSGLLPEVELPMLCASSVRVAPWHHLILKTGRGGRGGRGRRGGRA